MPSESQRRWVRKLALDRCKPQLRPAMNPPLRTATRHCGDPYLGRIALGFPYGSHVEAEGPHVVPVEDPPEGAWAVRAIEAFVRDGCRSECRIGYLAGDLIGFVARVQTERNTVIARD